MKYFNIKRFNFRPIDLLIILASIAVFIVLGANRSCGNTKSSPGRSELYVSPEITDLFENTESLFDEFERQHPHLRIRTTDRDRQADILFFTDSEIGGLLNNFALASLDPYMRSETQKEANRRAARYVMPLVSFMDLFFYNIDILEAAGSVRPPKTRTEFLETAKAVAALKSFYPLAPGLKSNDSDLLLNRALRRDIYPWIWADSQEIITVSAGGTASLSKSSANTIAFFGQLGREKLLAPDIFEKTAEDRLEEFAEGKIAMMIGSVRDIQYLRQREVYFGISTIPSSSVGKNRIGLSGIYAGISSECSLPDDAWAFLAFIAGKRQFMAQTLRAVPGGFPGEYSEGDTITGDSIAGDYIAKDLLLSKAWEIFEAAEIANYFPGEENESAIALLVLEKLKEALGY